MTKQFLAAVVIAVSLAGVCLWQTPAHAQSPTAAAFCYLNPGVFLGPILNTPTGWRWSLNCAYASSDGNNTVVSDIEILTLSGDTLATIAQKLANGVKADGAGRGYNIVAVLLPQVVNVTPQ